MSKRPRTVDFEKPLRSKRVRLSWPNKLSRIIPKRLEKAIKDSAAARFLRQTVNLLHAEGEDTSWTVHRFLGAGAFGTVALWVQRNDNGEIQDEVAIKEERCPHAGKAWNIDDYRMDDENYSLEALIQSLVNEQSSSQENVVYLRKMVTQMKLRIQYYDTQYSVRSEPHVCRYYLEYAPYGNLDDLMLRYRAFNYYMPELFLWHVFDSLAAAICTLDFNHDPFPDSGFDHVLHLDIKPVNIILGYEIAHHPDRIGGLQARAYQPEPDSAGGAEQTPHYPSLKLADFGVSIFSTSRAGEEAETFKNTAELGTTGFMPPEQARRSDCEERGVGGKLNIYGGVWVPLPYKGEQSYPLQTAKMNVWSIGKTMLDLVTLSRPGSFMDKQADSREEFDSNGHSMLPDFDVVPFNDRFDAGSRYSEGLTDLIEKCLKVDPSDRPTPRDLKQQTQRHLESCLEAGSRPQDEDRMGGWKLYYRNNDINGIDEIQNEDYKADFPFTAKDLVSLMFAHHDPDEPELQLRSDRLWQSHHDSMNKVTLQKNFKAEIDKRKLDEQQSAESRARLLDSYAGSEDEDLWFRDSGMIEEDSTSEDQGNDRNRDAIADGKVIFKGRILDLSKMPKSPTSPYEMFVKFRQMDAKATFSESQMLKEWSRLSQEQRAVFEELNQRAKLYHKHHTEGFRTLPTLGTHRATRSAQGPIAGPAQQRRERAVREWKLRFGRRPRNPERIQSEITALLKAADPQFTTWWKARYEQDHPNELTRKSQGTQDRFLDEQWHGLSSLEKTKFEEQYLAFLKANHELEGVNNATTQVLTGDEVTEPEAVRIDGAAGDQHGPTVRNQNTANYPPRVTAQQHPPTAPTEARPPADAGKSSRLLPKSDLQPDVSGQRQLRPDHVPQMPPPASDTVGDTDPVPTSPKRTQRTRATATKPPAKGKAPARRGPKPKDEAAQDQGERRNPARNRKPPVRYGH